MTTAQLEAMAATNDFPSADSPENIRDAPPEWMAAWKASQADMVDAVHVTNWVRCQARDGTITLADPNMIEEGRLALLDHRRTPPHLQFFYPVTNAAGRIVFVEK